jgi:molybdenum cofactor biosynthesis protein B
MSHQEHQHRANQEHAAPIHCGILTVSDSRTPDDDTSGAAIRLALEQAGHTVSRYAIVPDDLAEIVAQVRQFEQEGCQVLLTNGGTGIARRDVTIEAVEGVFDREIPGFGEVFRSLSFQEIGASAILSRATAGIFRTMLIYCLPGSTGAVRLAMEQLIIPTLPHQVWELHRSSVRAHPLPTRSSPPQLTHLDAQGQAHMVDVGEKASSWREAIARGGVQMDVQTLHLIGAGDIPKGDVLAVARVAGIQAAKRTAEIIPLCHSLPLTSIALVFTPDEKARALVIEATVRCYGKTGVEMEALTAVSVAALTIYDMAKSVDRTMQITNVRLVQKRGGKNTATIDTRSG